ncbi:PhzF family phenazine biosynthesis protein [Microbulbifer variabilis]|uniref:PhzF family phenazine biosynthesis protein n=1 Tax=Microbulbifer variabilis TaxID=266805 RepID=UPI001CFC85BA|nr:PhzF family phenazine biosynthesis protein [Microbulbifer variabilis]
MQVEINIVDAFTDVQFGGNSAAVIIIEEWLSKPLMQSIAAQNNLSETAFLRRCSDSEYQVRWFSPLTEIDFCGHATLASAFVVFRRHPHLKGLDFFAEAVGDMHISRNGDGLIAMDFPSRPPQPLTSIPSDLLEGLSITPTEVLRNNQAYFAVYTAEEDILRLQQDATKLARLAPYDVVVTAQSKKYDFISRYFWPANGGAEDPVTGSIHTGLAPYWGEKLSKSNLIAYQASKRGGLLHCQLEGERVIISGNAVPYLNGVIDIAENSQ